MRRVLVGLAGLVLWAGSSGGCRPHDPLPPVEPVQSGDAGGDSVTGTGGAGTGGASAQGTGGAGVGGAGTGGTGTGGTGTGGTGAGGTGTGGTGAGGTGTGGTGAGGQPSTLHTFAFTAHVTRIDDPGSVFAGNIAVGDAMTGSYTFDAASADDSADPTVGLYPQRRADTGLIVNVKSWTFKSDPVNIDFLVEVVNRPSIDNYQVLSRRNLVTPALPGIAPATMVAEWQLDDVSATALSDDTFPVVPPNLPDWTQPFGLSVSNIGPNPAGPGPGQPPALWLVRGVVDTITPQ